MALPQRRRPPPPAGGDRPQPGQPQLRARPLPGQQRVEFLLGAGLRRLPARLGRRRRGEAANTLETYSDDYLPAGVAAACEAAGSGRGHAARLLLRRRAQPARRGPPSRAAGPQPRADGHARRLHAAWGRSRRSCATGGWTPRRSSTPTGNVPPEAIENAFRLLKPTAEFSQYANLWENLWNDEYMEGYQAMGQWARDHVPFPGAAFRQTVEQLVRAQRAMDGSRLGGKRVDLAAIRVPGAQRDRRARPHRAAGRPPSRWSSSSAPTRRRSCGSPPATSAWWPAARRRR